MLSRYSYLLILNIIFFIPEAKTQKIHGVCTVAPKYQVIDEYFDPIININANWIAVVPYAFCDPKNPLVIFNHPRQWQGEKPNGIIKTIQLAKQRGLKVLIKPHLWVKGQGWAGDLIFDSNKELLTWQKSYKEYLLKYSHIADSMDVEMISIGTELKKLIVKDEPFWVDLICDIRNIYNGDLTYSANWDNYENVSIWDQLDYVGIDAYFPVNEKQSPSVEEVKKSFRPVKEKLSRFSEVTEKPILFTEFGFRSIDHCANGHWIGDYENGGINLECQQNAYQGLFLSFWNEQWFAGGFIWKWFFKNNEAGGPSNDKFTPQNKSAIGIISSQFAVD
ncbi:MAG: hypothetical protein JXR07_05260 [Reichenbachiella sp.]